MKYLQLNRKTITFAMSPYSVINSDDVLDIDTTAGAVTINLEPIAGVRWGVYLNDISGTNIITVVPDGAETVNGLASYTFQWANAAVSVHSASSTNWAAISTLLPVVSWSLTTQNTLHVMKNGNNGTALPDRLDLPYLTISGAMSIASSGDTIVIRPGNYAYSTDWPIVLKDNVKLKFMEGARLVNDNIGGIFISDNFSPVITSIENLQFVFTAGWSWAIGVNISNSNSIIDIKWLWADRQWLLATTSTTLLNCILGTLNVSNINAINQWSLLSMQNWSVNLEGVATQQALANTAWFINKSGGALYCNGKFIANTSSTWAGVVNLTAGSIHGQDHYIWEFVNLNANARSFGMIWTVWWEPQVFIQAKCVWQILCFKALSLVINGIITAWVWFSIANATTPVNARVIVNADLIVSVAGININNNNDYRADYSGTIINTWVAASSHWILWGNTANRLTVRTAKIVLASATAFAHNSTVANTPFRVGQVQSNRPVSANTLLLVNPAGFINSVNVV